MKALLFTSRIPEPDPGPRRGHCLRRVPMNLPIVRTPVLSASVGSRTPEANWICGSSWPFRLAGSIMSANRETMIKALP